jgi:iron complex transport system substrate-binding protein
MQAQRVLSLLPSATEIVHGLGCGDRLVGRSEECDYPPEVCDLPVVMRARMWDSARPSSEIDRRVQETRGRAESLYQLDLDLLRQLAPDLILTQELCGVCSVTESEVLAACRSSDLAPQILTLTPRRLSEVWNSIQLVANALRVPDRGAKFVSRISEATRVSGSPPRAGVAVIEWLDPPIVAGLWTPDMIFLAGGTPVLSTPGRPGVRSTWADLERIGIDLLLLSPCSFSISRTLEEMEDADIAASVGSVPTPLGTWIVDEANFSRPGPRLLCGVLLIRSLIHSSVPPADVPATRWPPVARPMESRV